MKKRFYYALLFFLMASPALATYRDALEYLRKENYPGAVDALQDTLLTDSKSQYLMGFMYYHGLGVPKSYRQAAELFEK